MKQGFLITGTLCAVLTLAGVGRADDSAIGWKDIVGIVQAGNTVGVGSGQVTGGGQPWTTSGGVARVNLATGRVDLIVTGLVLAGGNAIGTPGAITQVRGTMVCDTNGSADGNSVLVDTEAVSLSPEGDAQVHDVVTIPPACLEPDIALLIRIVGGPAEGRWIANGAILQR